MVVEFLTFVVGAGRVDAWLSRDAEVWTAFLRDQPGFVDKQTWRPDAEPDTVCAVIWWESLAHWKAIKPEMVVAVDALMGDLAVEPVCVSYSVSN